MKRWISLILALVMLVSCIILPPASAEAEAGKVFYVQSAYMWREVAKKVNALADTSNVKIYVTNNLNFSSYTPPQITTFNGLLDGQGYTFSNIAMSGGEINSASLIKTLGGTIQNLNLDSTCSFTNTYKGAKTGAFAANTTKGALIYRCYSSATVSAPNGGDHVGGFVGTGNQGITLDGCVFKGTVISNGTGWNGCSFIGYSTDTTIRIYNSLAMGMVTASNSGMVRMHASIFKDTNKLPFYNTYTIGNRVACFNGTPSNYYNSSLKVNGHPFTAEALEEHYLFGEEQLAQLLYKINDEHVETGRAQVYFSALQDVDSTISFRMGNEKERMVKMTTICNGAVEIRYLAPRMLAPYGSTTAQKQAEVIPQAVEGMVPVVSQGAEYRNGKIYVGNRDFAVTYITEAEHALNQAKKTLQGLVDAYKAMDPEYFTNWNEKQAWLAGAEAALADADATAAMLQAQITAENNLADGVRAINYPEYPSISKYRTYQPIASIKDYSVGSAEEWLAAIRMSDFNQNPDATDFSGITIHLTDTIDLQGQPMLPLCYGGVFDGNLDGHDYTFENININIDTPYGPVGLIAQANKNKNTPRTLKNLGIGSGSIKVTGYPLYKSDWDLGDTGNKVGGFVGRTNAHYYKFYKCWNNAEIRVTHKDNAGGIIGDGRRNVSMDYCLNLGAVSGCGWNGYGQNSVLLTNSITHTTDEGGTYIRPEVDLQQRLANCYGILNPATLSHSPTAEQNAAAAAFNAQYGVLNLAEAAWKANQGYVNSGFERAYYTLNEKGEVRFGTAQNQVRRVTLKSEGQKDQYLYGIPGQTIALTFSEAGAKANFFEYNHFALAENYPQTTIKANQLTLGNEDVTVYVTKNVNIGDANSDGILNLLDAIITIKKSVDDTATINATAANVDSNYMVDLRDALAIVRQWLNPKRNLFIAGLPKESRADYIKLLSYNIKSFFYVEGEGTFDNGDPMCRYDVVLEELKAIDADIMGFQEVDVFDEDSAELHQLAKLATDLKQATGETHYYSFFTTVPDKDNIGGYGHGILSKYPILEEGGEHFSGATYDGQEPRGYAWYQLDLNTNGVYDKGSDLLYYNCHLAEFTAQQLAYMAKRLEAEYDAGHRIACTGDFNLAAWGMKGCFDTDKLTALNGNDRFNSFCITTTSGTGSIDNIILSDNVDHYWNEGQNIGTFSYHTDASDHLPLYTYIKKLAGQDLPADLPEQEAPTDYADWIKVCSYNVKVLYYDHVNNKNGTPMSKFDAVCEELRKIDADIVGLQELDRFSTRCGTSIDQLEELRKALGYPYSYYTKTIPSYGTNSEYGHGILSRYPIQSSQSYLFANFEGSIDGSEPRGFSRNVLNVEGKTLVFYNTHLANQSPKQMNVIAGMMNEDQKAGNYAVLTGDMNEYPKNLAEPVTANNCTQLNSVEAPQQTVYSADYAAIVSGATPIDNIVVSNNLDYYWDQQAQSGIFVNYTSASDHLPIYTMINFK